MCALTLSDVLSTFSLPFSAVISLARPVLKHTAQLFQTICKKTVTTMAANEENGHF